MSFLRHYILFFCVGDSAGATAPEMVKFILDNLKIRSYFIPLKQHDDIGIWETGDRKNVPFGQGDVQTL